MKPVKSLLPFSRWLLRISLLLYMVLQHGHTFKAMQVDSQSFFIATAFLLLSVLVFAGGFMSKSSLTVVSALLLSLLTVYYIYLGFKPVLDTRQVLNLLVLSVSLVLMTSPDK